MPTGACGIDCDVCKLRLLGTCSTCGSGKSPEAQMKLSAQQRIFGGTCAILECAALNHLAYCPRDCDAFPCDNFRIGPYPFSEGFLTMQHRRKQQRPPARSPNNVPVTVPSEYWDDLETRDILHLCTLTLTDPDPPAGPAEAMIFHSLNEAIRVDIPNRRLMRRGPEGWEATDDPLLELITLVYFKNVAAVYPLGKEIVGPKDLKEAHFFQGPHVLRTDHLLERYGEDPDGFRRAARFLSGAPLDMADAAFELRPFPRIPLYYLLWEGDREYPPRLSILFDRTIEEVFAADAIWGLVNYVSLRLIQGPGQPF
jgi:hypothetical protein